MRIIPKVNAFLSKETKVQKDVTRITQSMILSLGSGFRSTWLQAHVPDLFFVGSKAGEGDTVGLRWMRELVDDGIL